MDYYSNESNDGNIGVFLLNISDDVQHIRKGDRIAQGAFFNFLAADMAIRIMREPVDLEVQEWIDMEFLTIKEVQNSLK